MTHLTRLQRAFWMALGGWAFGAVLHPVLGLVAR